MMDEMKKAKLMAVSKMRKEAADQLLPNIKNIKKVTVASSDPEGLSEGLDKAKEVLASKMSEHEDTETPEVETQEQESVDHENKEMDELQTTRLKVEQLEKDIAELKSLLIDKKDMLA